MGIRQAALFGFMLLLSGGNLCAANRNGSNSDETLNPQEKSATSAQLLRSALTQAQPEHGDPPRSLATYRLKTYQIRNPAVRRQKPPRPVVEHMQTSQDLQRLEASEQQEPGVPVQKLIQGPDLNPPVKPESKVLMLVFEQRVPVPAQSVAVRCGGEKVTIEVKQNFLGNGQLIRASDLTLGGCAALDAAHPIVQFQTELGGCGSTVTMTEDALIYTFSLKYAPTPISNTFILKTNPAEVLIECHYRRRHYVSGGAVRPTWKQFASDMLAEQQLHFSLRLMTEDWQSQRPSSVYFLSDVMHIEAAVLRGHHVPLRVFVDSCVATESPDPDSEPRYPFITNHGCLSDAKLTGAKSYFMQRSQEDKLHFQLKAFKFRKDHRNSVYITCRLKATKLSVPIDRQHKVCSFLTEANRWVASGGDNKVCDCCESSCSERRQKRSLAAADAVGAAELRWEGTAALGPVLLLEENIPPEEPAELQTLQATRAASFLSMALLCGVEAALAVVLLVFMAAIICRRKYKEADGCAALLPERC